MLVILFTLLPSPLVLSLELSLCFIPITILTCKSPLEVVQPSFPLLLYTMLFILSLLTGWRLLLRWPKHSQISPTNPFIWCNQLVSLLVNQPRWGARVISVCVGMRSARVTTGHIGITSSLSRKLGKYPSELNWSSLGDVLGFIYVTKVCTDQAMLRMAANGKWGAGLRVKSDEWQKRSLSW